MDLVCGQYGGCFIDSDNSAGVAPDMQLAMTTYCTSPTSTPATLRLLRLYTRAPAEDWNVTGALGWNQGSAGATVGTFDTQTNVLTLVWRPESSYAAFAAGVITTYTFFRRLSLIVNATDRVYVLWKHTDAITANQYRDENIRYGFTTMMVWSEEPAPGLGIRAFPAVMTDHPVPNTASGLFQNGALHEIEDNWAYVDRITAVADGRIPGVRGDLHVFSGGDSHGFQTGASTNANSIFHSL